MDLMPSYYHCQCGKYFKLHTLLSISRLLFANYINKFYCILHLLDTKNLISHRLPFDWKNPMGYLLAVALQYTVSTYIFFLLAGFSALAIGSYFIGLTGAKEIRICIFETNRRLQTKYERAYIHRFIFIFIQWHSRLKQLSPHLITT